MTRIRTEPIARRSASLTLALLLTAAVSCPHRAHAHAGPQVRDLKGGATQSVLLSNRGLIFGSADSGWSLMCNEALGVNTAEIPDLVTLPDGRLMAASSRGLSVSADGGCSWQGVAPYDQTNAPALVQHPTELQRLFLATFGPGETGLSVSDDAGKNWKRLLVLGDTEYLRFVRIAPSKPERMYARNLSFGDGKKFSYEVLRSDNAGKDWERSSVTLEDAESDLVLLGVSSTDPNLLIGKAESSDPMTRPERLLVSHDGGKSFVNPIAARVISSVAFSADGKTIWVAADEGLFRSTDNAEHFARVGSAEYLSCVQEKAGVLLVCGFYRGIPTGMQGVGKSSDGGETFDALLQLHDVKQPIKCDEQAATEHICKPLWKDWEREILGIVETPDAGSAGDIRDAGTSQTKPDAAAISGNDAGRRNDAGARKPDAGHVPDDGRHVEACGCRTLGAGATTTPLAALGGSMLLFVLWRVRRRRA